MLSNLYEIEQLQKSQLKEFEKKPFELKSEHFPFVVGAVALILTVTVADYYKKRKKKKKK